MEDFSRINDKKIFVYLKILRINIIENKFNLNIIFILLLIFLQIENNNLSTFPSFLG